MCATRFAKGVFFTLELSDLARRIAGVALSFFLLLESGLAARVRGALQGFTLLLIGLLGRLLGIASCQFGCILRLLSQLSLCQTTIARLRLLQPLRSLPQNLRVVHIGARAKALLCDLLGARCCASSLADSRLLKPSHFSPSPLFYLTIHPEAEGRQNASLMLPPYGTLSATLDARTLPKREPPGEFR